MKKTLKYIFLFSIFLLLNLDIFAQRFPKPEFEEGHTQPPIEQSQPRSEILEYLDVFVLILALSVVTWFVLSKRSRKGVFWMSVFSIAYFGFFREGCVCSVGSIQNIALALFNPGYKIPLTALAFFLIPLLYTLFFGRTFCAGVCPLGAIQDIIAFRPVELKSWVQSLLGIFPFIYLGLAVLYAATGTDFIICKYDPFVGFFRLDATFSMFLLGIAFLVLGVFIARPYCRFFCPYGVLLNLVSRFSKTHLTITPSSCISCKLCDNSCPFGAIDKPEPLKLPETRQQSVRRFIIFGTLIPVLIFIGAWTGSQFHENLAKVNHKVSLAQELYLIDTDSSKTFENSKIQLELDAFKTSGQSVEELYTETTEILSDFKTGGIWLGGFIGLVFGLTLLGFSIFRYKNDYSPNKATCFSCARCIDYCPVELNND